MNKLTVAEQIEALKIEAKLKEENKVAWFDPNLKQQAFFDLGISASERLLRSGNQIGKTEAGAVEFSYHMTGLYPPDWMGYRFKKHIRAWICGVTGLVVRNVQQERLCGAPGQDDALGTGLIPRHCFTQKPTMARGVSDAYDTIFVKHVSGGISTATFKSYEQGRTKFQGEPVDLIWADEEAPMDIYSEMLARITATRGIIYTTFTPLLGVTELVLRFRETMKGRGEVLMTIDDATHLNAEDKELLKSRYPKHEHPARLYGIPMAGEGAVFEEVTREMLTVPLRVVGDQIWHSKLGAIQTGLWGMIWGIDFGIGHPFAAVLLGHDRDYDCVYVLAEIKMEGGVPAEHASRMKAIAAHVPVAWPHDGNQREKGSGLQLIEYYKREGLIMLPSHATFKDGGYSTEAGVMELLTRMRKDQFKAAEGCVRWFDEFSGYHRKDGLIVKKFDDLLSATRIGMMQIRSAKVTPLGAARPGFSRQKSSIRPPGVGDYYFGID